MTSRVNCSAELNVRRDTPALLHKSRMNAGTFGTVKRAIISPKPFLLNIHPDFDAGGLYFPG